MDYSSTPRSLSIKEPTHEYISNPKLMHKRFWSKAKSIKLLDRFVKNYIACDLPVDSIPTMENVRKDCNEFVFSTDSCCSAPSQVVGSAS